MTAFDDSELSEWLIQSIEEAPSQFLRALAEAAVTACPEDYSLVRPGLVRLKRKYCLASAPAKETGRPTRGSRSRVRSLRSSWNQLT